MVGVLLVGWVAFLQLPVSALPEVDYPTIQVVTFYPGADPDVMASSVTSPLERQFGQVPGLSQMTSTSSFGSSVITLQFGLDQNIDVEETAGAGCGECGSYVPARRFAESADLQQSESGGFAYSHAGAQFGFRCRCPRWKIWPTLPWRRKFRSCPVWGWFPSVVDRSPPYECK